MHNELAFLIGAGLTALVSLVVVVYLQRPLLRALTEACGTEQRARVWTAYSNVVILLLPLLAVLLARVAPPASDSLLFAVVGYLQWSFVGLVLATLIVAVGAASIQPAEPVVTRNQIDDLQRLVAKIEEMRAHEIVRRSTAEKSFREAIQEEAGRASAAPGRAAEPGNAPLSEAPLHPA
jgi:hypothetical protein